MCSGSEVGSYLRLTYFVYHSILGLRVIKKNMVSICKSIYPGSVGCRTSHLLHAFALSFFERSVKTMRYHSRVRLQGYLAQRKQLQPPRATIGSYAESYCRVLGRRCFL